MGEGLLWGPVPRPPPPPTPSQDGNDLDWSDWVGEPGGGTGRKSRKRILPLRLAPDMRGHFKSAAVPEAGRPPSEHCERFAPAASAPESENASVSARWQRRIYQNCMIGSFEHSAEQK